MLHSWNKHGKSSAYSGYLRSYNWSIICAITVLKFHDNHLPRVETCILQRTIPHVQHFVSTWPITEPQSNLLVLRGVENTTHCHHERLCKNANTTQYLSDKSADRFTCYYVTCNYIWYLCCTSLVLKEPWSSNRLLSPVHREAKNLVVVASSVSECER